MTLDELILEGEEIKEVYQSQGVYSGWYISCIEYATWLTKATNFLETNFGSTPDVIRFRKLAEEANGNGYQYYNPIMGILKAFKEFTPLPQKPSNYDIIIKMLRNFDRFAIQIKRRYDNRSSIHIKDEYDVQDLLHAILKLLALDIRPEEWTPSYAGGSSRMDFYLPDEKLVIETKMTRDKLKDKNIGEELIIDIAKYKQHQGCEHLLCFVYDKESYIHNPIGLKKDLGNLSDDQMKATVVICPE